MSVNPACCTGLPHAADAVMGMLGPRPCCPQDLPADVTVRALEPGDWADVRRIYAEGIATGNATFETEVPDRRTLDHAWLPEHRWVAELDGQVVGWAAAKPVSTRPVYAGVAETSIYVGDGYRGRGVGKALIHRQVTAADNAGLWTLQTVDLPGEPGQHRPAPVRRLPHPRRARTHRPPPRRLARHRLPRTPPHRPLTPSGPTRPARPSPDSPRRTGSSRCP